MQIALLVQNLTDTAGAGYGEGDHDEDHGENHQTHQDVHTVSEKRHQITGFQSAVYNHVGTKPADQKDAGVYGEHHQRVVENYQALSLRKHIVDVLTGSGKTLFLIILPDISFHYANCGYIFLHTFIQFVVFFKSMVKILHGLSDDDRQCNPQENDRCKIYAGQRRTDKKGHSHGTQYGSRCTHCHAQDHLVCILDVGHVGCESCDESGSAELVDVGEGVCLYVLKHCLSQVLTKSHRSLGTEFCTHTSGKK